MLFRWVTSLSAGESAGVKRSTRPDEPVGKAKATRFWAFRGRAERRRRKRNMNLGSRRWAVRRAPDSLAGRHAVFRTSGPASGRATSFASRSNRAGPSDDDTFMCTCPRSECRAVRGDAYRVQVKSAGCFHCPPVTGSQHCQRIMFCADCLPCHAHTCAVWTLDTGHTSPCQCVLAERGTLGPRLETNTFPEPKLCTLFKKIQPNVK